MSLCGSIEIRVRDSVGAAKGMPMPTLPVVSGAVAAWAPGGDGVMLFDRSTGRLQWVQPSGEAVT
jgi:hypothetical protein